MYWVGLGIIVIAIIIACVVEDKYNIKFHAGCLFIFCGAIGGMIMIADKFDEANIPSALDVYRHKTALKITYVDGEPVDTIVVFKK